MMNALRSNTEASLHQRSSKYSSSSSDDRSVRSAKSVLDLKPEGGAPVLAKGETKEVLAQKQSNNKPMVVGEEEGGGKPVWIHQSVLKPKGGVVRSNAGAASSSSSSSGASVASQSSFAPSDCGSDDVDDLYEWRRGWILDSDETAPGTLLVRAEDRDAQPQQVVSLPKNALDQENVLLVANEATSIPHDLVSLQNFNEPAVVACLGERYRQGLFYTATGPVLIALNPFQQLPHLYSDDVMKKYWRKAEHSSTVATGPGGGGGNQQEALPPHVFAIADNAFRSMMRGIQKTFVQKLVKGVKRNQSILVSGESGAGKTVTTKFLMKYLVALSQRAAQMAAADSGRKDKTKKLPKSKRPHAAPPTVTSLARNAAATTLSITKSSIEAQVLQSNPILESFGNARTVRNDNSSRFGKFIEMQFSTTGRLLGTNIQTYLLEKVRLVSQNAGERNYHIFYEILSSGTLSSTEKSEILLLDPQAKPRDFKILSGGSTFDRRDGVPDKDTFRDLKKALNTMGFTENEQKQVLQVTATILHASSLTFLEEGASGGADLIRDNPHLTALCTLWGVTADALNEALCYSSITARGTTFKRPQNLKNAEKGLDGLIKAVYGALFSYLVDKINESIAFREVPGEDTKLAANIGVLDIFGFESFETNSFEQLCINYCNEALQQQFNTFMFKNEQAEYANEGVDFDVIKFPENQDVIDLIDQKNVGIMSILDDMCRAPGTTDNTFLQQVNKTCAENSRFVLCDTPNTFAVHHYAGRVDYTSKGFVEKNRDELPKETSDLLMNSTNPFIQTLSKLIVANSPCLSAAAAESNNSNHGKAPPKTRREAATVGGFFRRQLTDLREKINSTSPHFVRCIKPNQQLVADKFDSAMVAQQLRCGGILQAVSLTRNGFTLHYTFAEFVERYGILAETQKEKKPPAPSSVKVDQAECKRLVETLTKMLEKTAQNDSSNKSSKEKKGSNDCSSEGKLIEFGKSKVLLKHNAFETLEAMLGAVHAKNATKLNATFRRHLARKAFFKERDAFRQDLKRSGQTFSEWFAEHRELYYRPRDKSGKLEIKNLVSLRLKQIKGKTTGSSSPAAAKVNKKIEVPGAENFKSHRDWLLKASSGRFRKTPPPPRGPEEGGGGSGGSVHSRPQKFPLQTEAEGLTSKKRKSDLTTPPPNPIVMKDRKDGLFREHSWCPRAPTLLEPRTKQLLQASKWHSAAMRRNASAILRSPDMKALPSKEQLDAELPRTHSSSQTTGNSWSKRPTLETKSDSTASDTARSPGKAAVQPQFGSSSGTRSDAPQPAKTLVNHSSAGTDDSGKTFAKTKAASQLSPKAPPRSISEGKGLQGCLASPVPRRQVDYVTVQKQPEVASAFSPRPPPRSVSEDGALKSGADAASSSVAPQQSQRQSVASDRISVGGQSTLSPAFLSPKKPVFTAPGTPKRFSPRRHSMDAGSVKDYVSQMPVTPGQNRGAIGASGGGSSGYGSKLRQIVPQVSSGGKSPDLATSSPVPTSMEKAKVQGSITPSSTVLPKKSPSLSQSNFVPKGPALKAARRWSTAAGPTPPISVRSNEEQGTATSDSVTRGGLTETRETHAKSEMSQSNFVPKGPALKAARRWSTAAGPAPPISVRSNEEQVTATSDSVTRGGLTETRETHEESEEENTGSGKQRKQIFRAGTRSFDERTNRRTTSEGMKSPQGKTTAEKDFLPQSGTLAPSENLGDKVNSPWIVIDGKWSKNPNYSG